MRPYDVIRKKREGKALTKREIQWFVNSHVKGNVLDYHASAFLMATFFQGMTPKETAYLTDAFMHSGDVVDLSQVKGYAADKHSTGGVGDTVSLILAPLVASLGVKVPMVSGRGLGHTGGTLDKLEAIPGFRTDLSTDVFLKIVDQIGFSMIGQTERMCPADKRWYALRDVTATVESIPLIVASIMSKKLAEGIDGLVLDVKTGSGAFMKTMEDSENLAKALVSVGKAMKRDIKALITDMSQPLARSIGNALETAEAIGILQDKIEGPLRELSIELSSNMLIMAGRYKTLAAARKGCESNLKNGKALKTFAKMIKAQDGDPKVCDDTKLLPQAKKREAYKATKNGYIQSMDCAGLGLASIALGAGRAAIADVIDPAVGLVMDVRIGDRVKKGQKLLTIHANDPARLKEAKKRLSGCIVIGKDPVTPPELFRKVIE